MGALDSMGLPSTVSHETATRIPIVAAVIAGVDEYLSCVIRSVFAVVALVVGDSDGGGQG